MFRQGFFSKNYCTLRDNVKTYIKKRDKLKWKYLGALRRRRDKSTWQRKKTYAKTVTKLTLHCQETTVQAGRKRDKTTWQHEGTKVHVGKEHEKITPQYQGLTVQAGRKRDKTTWQHEGAKVRVGKEHDKITPQYQGLAVQAGRKRDKTTWQYQGIAARSIISHDNTGLYLNSAPYLARLLTPGTPPYLKV